LLGALPGTIAIRFYHQLLSPFVCSSESCFGKGLCCLGFVRFFGGSLRAFTDLKIRGLMFCSEVRLKHRVECQSLRLLQVSSLAH